MFKNHGKWAVVSYRTPTSINYSNDNRKRQELREYLHSILFSYTTYMSEEEKLRQSASALFPLETSGSVTKWVTQVV